MGKQKRTPVPTKLVSVRLPVVLIQRIDDIVERRIKDTNSSMTFTRSMAIQELLNTAVTNQERRDTNG